MGWIKRIKQIILKSEEPPQDWELLKRLTLAERLKANAHLIYETVQTPGWQVIEDVLVDSIISWQKDLNDIDRLNPFTKPEEVYYRQIAIQIFTDFLLKIDEMEEGIKWANQEIKEVKPQIEIEKSQTKKGVV